MTSCYPPPLRVAIVGTGGIALTHGWRAQDLGSTVVAVCGRRLGGARDLAARLGGRAATYDDLAALLQAERVDVLHVCSPHTLHVEHSLAGFAAGTHVICEKPLATSREGALRLLERASASDRVAAVCLTKRSYPMVAEIRARALAGELGELRAVRGEYLSSDSCHDRFTWAFDREVAGPLYATGDLGVHWLDLVEHTTARRVVSVYARFSTMQRERIRDGETVSIDVEDYVRVLLDLEGGVAASATFSGVAPGHPNRCAISLDGSEGGLDWSVDEPDRLVGRPRLGPTQLITRDPTALSAEAARLTTSPAGHAEGFSDAFRNLFRDVYSAIAGSAVGYPTFADGARVQVLVDALARSAATGAPAEVPEPDR